MYTEENMKGKFPIRDVLLKVIIVVVFIILVCFIIAKIIGPSNNTINSNYDKVFSENLKEMKEAAIKYYTKDKLPTEDGDSKELTLREMVNLDLLEAFTDANNKACDVTESYVRLTKNGDSYTLRVNLKCSEQEDYTLTKLGEYDYCKYDICEKDASHDQKETTEEQSEVVKEVEITDPDINNNSNQSNNSNNSNNSNSGSSGGNTTSQKELMYEYKKDIPPVLSSWGAWSDWILNNENYTAVKCNDNDYNCLKEIQLTSRREKIGTKNGKAVYGIVNYYSYRTRSVVNTSQTDIKWSTHNDRNLLDNGYSYTGNTR